MLRYKEPHVEYYLTPSMQVKEVTLVGFDGCGWQFAQDGRQYHEKNLHISREVAIAAGHARLDAQAKRLEKQHATLAKRRATLNKQVAK